MKALPGGALSEDVVNLISTMKPVMAGMLGQFGKALEFIVYTNVQGGRKILSAKSKGEFDYRLYDQTFHWKLPLGSLLPDKVDPETGETFPGDYVFSPYTGRKLKEKGT